MDHLRNVRLLFGLGSPLLFSENLSESVCVCVCVCVIWC
jgi:hypothetical protein